MPADKTATMYRSLRPTHFGGGAATAALAALLSEGERPSQEDCVNSFDAVANEVLQGLEPARRAFGVALAPRLDSAQVRARRAAAGGRGAVALRAVDA